MSVDDVVPYEQELDENGADQPLQGEAPSELQLQRLPEPHLLLHQVVILQYKTTRYIDK